jgi:isopenicillin N synthase-like dioxygenase
MQNIPVIDIAPAAESASGRKAVAKAIDDACRDIGFFSIMGHGVPETLIERTRAMGAAFFAQDEAAKLAVERPPQKISRGYFRHKDRSLSYTLGVAAPPDLQEAFAFGPEVASDEAYQAGDVRAALRARNIWPATPPGFRETMVEYYSTMSALGMRMLAIMAHALGVEENYFVDKFDHESSAARLIRYPAQSGAPEENQLRAGAHTDYGAVTYVRGDNVPGGLQVKLRHGDWIEVTRPQGGFVCNISDAMARWTNDRWVSTLHRVGNPPPEARGTDRISLVFFNMPNHDALIRCIPGCEGTEGAKYPPITYADHYLGKLMKAGHARHDAGVADAVAAAR